MKDYDCECSLLKEEVNTIFIDLPESKHIVNVNEYMKNNLDAKWQKANICLYLRKYKHLSMEDR